MSDDRVVKHEQPARGPGRCPVCAADLRGQAAPNRCDECGFVYDADTRLWRSNESWARLALVYMIYGFTAGLLVALLSHATLKRPAYATLPLLLALLTPALGLGLRRLFSGRISGRFVAVGRAGFVVGTRARPLTIEWDDFERLTEQRGVLKIQRKSNPALVPLDDLFATPQESSEFRDVTRRLARQHRRTESDDGRRQSG